MKHESNNGAEPIAIIGIGCQYPGVRGPVELWRLLREAGEVVGPMPEERFKRFTALFDPELPTATPGKIACDQGGYFDRVDGFDQGFFGISPREIASMDPQQRKLLEVAWDTLEDSAQRWDELSGQEIGVFIGSWITDWEQMLYRSPKSQLDLYCTTGSGRYALSGRISYFFNFLGPSITIDTACSTSLVAIHMACQSLRNGESRMALAGGVNIILEPSISVAYSRSGMISPRGRCKFGDADAKGYVRSEGCALIALKSLSQALADGDRIYATIAGSAVNSDGQTGMFVAPSPDGHEVLIRKVCKVAGITPDRVRYVEAHGTGTLVGDPAELNALHRALVKDSGRSEPLLVGSAKTSLGHTESAAGVTGIIKTALCLHHRTIPPNRYPEQPNPSILWDELNIRIPRENIELHDDGSPIYAGVSALGITGTNAHAILCSCLPEPAKQRETADSSPSPFGPNTHVLPLSARGDAGLREVAKIWADYLASVTDTELADVLYTASSRRTHLEDRLVVEGDGPAELAASLARFASGETPTRLWTGHTQTSGAQPVFVFSGQGAHWWAMGRVLFESQSVYRDLIQRFDVMMKPLTGWSLIDELMADPEQSQLGLMTIGQPALFAVQLGVAAVWRSWGVEPAAVVGHSMGEVTAAVESGALSLEDGVRVIVHRARVMDAVLGKGTMAAAELSPDEAEAYLESHQGQLSIAAINGPKSISISGTYEAIDVLISQLESANVFCRKLKVDLPAHSRFMQQASEELTEACRDITARSADVPIYSTVTGALAQGESFDAEYWGVNLRQSVQFATAAQAIIDDGRTVFLEMNPHPILKVSLNQCLDAAEKKGLVLGSLRREENDLECMIESLAALHLHGAAIEWDRIYPAGKIVPLPQYPWQHERFWPAILDEADSGVESVDGEAYPWRHWVSPDQPDTDNWQLELTTKSALVRDHRLRDRNLLPMILLIDMALQATASVHGREHCTISDFKATQAIEIKEGQRLRLNLSLLPSIPGQLLFKVASTLDSGGLQTALEWVVNAEGIVDLSGSATDPQPDSNVLEQIADPATAGFSQVTKAELYRNIQRKGCQLPEKSQHLETAWVCGSRVLAKLAAESPEQEPLQLLESACQLMVSLAPDPENSARSPIMPVAAGLFRGRSGQSAPAQWISVDVVHQDKSSIRCDVEFLDENATPVARLGELVLATPHDSHVDVRDWFFHLDWQTAEPITDEAPESAEGSWIILAKTHGTGDALGNALQERGYQCIIIKPNEPSPFGDDSRPFNPDDPEDYARVINLARNAASQPVLGLVNLLNGFMPKFGSPHENAMDDIIIHNCHGMLNLVQAVAAGEGRADQAGAGPMRLFLVTRGAQDVLPDAENLQLAQAPLWGMGKVIQHEHPELQCRLIDLDPAEPVENVQALIHELFTSSPEEQIAYRQAQRFAPRMVRTQLKSANDSQIASQHRRPVELTLTPNGKGQATSWQLATRPMPGPGQVLIQVEAVGLNGHDLDEMGKSAQPGHPIIPGMECAGRIAALGPNVEDLAIGDEVVALARNACATFVLASQMLVVKKPDGIGMAEAASLPMAYLNAVVAFSEAVKLRAGQRVLIHKADGPRGAAAVEIAKSLGAEIFATARQPATRDLLAAWGACQVYDVSRSDIVEQIMQITHDQGVDVILNLTDGESIEPLMELFTHSGILIDAAHHAPGTGVQTARIHDHVRYHRLDVGEMIELDPDKSGEYLRSLMARLFYFKSVPIKEFAAQDADKAFQWMREGFDTCKFVLTLNHRAVSDPAPVFLPDAGYLITGGLGGLGLAVAQRMVDHGARRIALMGRSEPKPEARAAIEAMERQGARIKVVGGDVTSRDDLADALHAIEWELGPLRGIMHCAGMLADGVLQQQTWGNFVKVLAPKVRGGWLLHELTENIPLDFFVMFSSWASVLGSPGQANHSAANAFLDALTVYRRAHGLAAQSINWGPWSDIGVASGKGQGNKLAVRGVGEFTATEGLRSLELLMAHNPVQSTVMPFDLIQWHRSHPHASKTRRFDPIAEQYGPSESDTAERPDATAENIHDQLLNAESATGRLEIIQQSVCGQLGGILQMDPGRIDLNKPFKFLGLDSLTGLEFRNRLDNALNLSLHVSVVWNYPTVTEIAGYLLKKLDESLNLSDKSETQPVQADQIQPGDTPEQMDELLELLDNLSEDDAQRILSGEDIHGN